MERGSSVWYVGINSTVEKYYGWEKILILCCFRNPGISHGEEMFQVWNMEGVTKLVSFRELEFSRNFVKMIGDFVHGR